MGAKQMRRGRTCSSLQKSALPALLRWMSTQLCAQALLCPRSPGHPKIERGSESCWACGARFSPLRHLRPTKPPAIAPGPTDRLEDSGSGPRSACKRGELGSPPVLRPPALGRLGAAFDTGLRLQGCSQSGRGAGEQLSASCRMHLRRSRIPHGGPVLRSPRPDPTTWCCIAAWQGPGGLARGPACPPLPVLISLQPNTFRVGNHIRTSPGPSEQQMAAFDRT